MPDDEHDPIEDVVWPTLAEQQAALLDGCTCTIRHPDESERDPFCVDHGDRVLMRAALRKAYS